MNRQTSKLLTILLNSPGQYFHYEELAARFHVSTRSIRNYVQSILEFLEDQNLQPVLSVSEGELHLPEEPRKATSCCRPLWIMIFTCTGSLRRNAAISSC